MLRNTNKEKCRKCSAEKKLIKRINGRYGTKNLHYVDQKTKVELFCNTHGYFKQLPANIGRHGCSKCGRESMMSKQRMSLKEFVKKSKEIHGNRYLYSKVKYSNSHKNVIVTCPFHGDFEVTPANHIHNNSGCPSCGKRFSRQEYRISKQLGSLGIKFVSQKGFSDLRNPKTGQKLYYDFYLPEYNLLIEYDGEHHFRPIRFNGALTKAQVENEFKQIQYKDSIKNLYAEQRIDLDLVRISYREKIEERLLEIIEEHKRR